ncbi:hypothetical protein F3D3_3122 [Fusibacter sp. 3D3]|nr:GNAT family N-acetyltransferase [Fusibacter sp. 3D3]GAU78488.1 hypothetical protein F3D3_3122 [Fusibacter sp. 3D3]
MHLEEGFYCGRIAERGEQREGQFYMYVIRDENDAFIGRLNLQMMHSEHSTKAELGYRVDSEKQGKGYTSQAIKLILKEFLSTTTSTKLLQALQKTISLHNAYLKKMDSSKLEKKKR